MKSTKGTQGNAAKAKNNRA